MFFQCSITLFVYLEKKLSKEIFFIILYGPFALFLPHIIFLYIVGLCFLLESKYTILSKDNVQGKYLC